MSDPAKKIMERLDALARISEEPHQLTRTFASPAMRQANDLVASWMREAGMTAREDAIGNLIGRYDAHTRNTKTLLLGSHLDTVRNAGKFDGPLGVVLAIACIEELNRKKIRLPFAIDVIGFCDEEGVRYQSTYLGSSVLAGCFDSKNLKRTDAGGVAMEKAIASFGCDSKKIKGASYKAKDLIGYVEAHIEQGPVLEEQNLSVGVVTAIAGQSRLKLTFTGKAGHAGTTPMKLRQDALCASAEFILAVENFARNKTGLVATVGQIQNAPNASNVIPGEVQLTLDVRHQTDAIRRSAVKHLQNVQRAIAAKRKVKAAWQVVQETASVPCASNLSQLLANSVKKHQGETLSLASGAGHDGAVMSRICPVAMLFVRCKDGLSHHPDESAKAADVRVALNVMNDFLARLADQHERL